MPRNHLDTLVRRSINRTELLRALILGILTAACLLTAAYVSLSAGLWLAIVTCTTAIYMWRITERKRQASISDELTIPELNKAFEQMEYSLRGSLPEEEITSLYPEGCEVHCSDRIDSVWHGLPFTFANVEILGEMGRPLFHGQWLIVRTGWPDCVRVAVREQDGITVENPQSAAVAVRDAELDTLYRVESDRAGDAAALLTEDRLRGLLLSTEGIRLMVENGVLHLAMPSDRAFFTLDGGEQSAGEVTEMTQREIGTICSWLDRIIQVEFR